MFLPNDLKKALFMHNILCLLIPTKIFKIIKMTCIVSCSPCNKIAKKFRIVVISNILYNITKDNFFITKITYYLAGIKADIRFNRFVYYVIVKRVNI